MSNQRKDFDITNDMFQESIPITTKIILEDMPSNDELNHVFSKGCERKMKKRKIVLITLLLIGVLLLGSILYNLFLGKTANISMLKESWNFDIPIPNKEIEVFDTQDSINGDGQSYFIQGFSEKNFKKVFNLKGGIVVSKDNINEIKKYIDKFKRDSVNINKSNKNKIEADFKKYKLEVKKDDKYIYKKNYENYVVLIIKKDEQKLYSLIWNQ
ncbi:hypothetical protein [Clostridioides difficile]|uniref:hypothetical protein n=1 Tax=Clostridioides difficile TaxID=1496 RepID=UPI001033DB34|nr:hypothetical protein [Clostridioides difficile]